MAYLFNQMTQLVRGEERAIQRAMTAIPSAMHANTQRQPRTPPRPTVDSSLPREAAGIFSPSRIAGPLTLDAKAPGKSPHTPPPPLPIEHKRGHVVYSDEALSSGKGAQESESQAGADTVVETPEKTLPTPVKAPSGSPSASPMRPHVRKTELPTPDSSMLSQAAGATAPRQLPAAVPEGHSLGALHSLLAPKMVWPITPLDIEI